MRVVPRRILLCLLILSLTACASMDRSAYFEVPIEELIDRPLLYDGRRVRITGGYLVVGPPNVNLSHTTDGSCGGDTARYVTTTLPFSVFGAPPGQEQPYYGRVAIVEGRFDYSDRPWGDATDISPEEHYVGPLRHARVVSYGEQRCYRGGEERDRAPGGR
jgi:hypothetical protein